MSKLHEWQNVRKARRGMYFVVGRNVRTHGLRDRDDGTGFVYRWSGRLPAGLMGVIRHVQKRRELIWVDAGGRLYAFTFDEARRVGHIFPDRLRAEVALKSNALEE